MSKTQAYSGNRADTGTFKNRFLYAQNYLGGENGVKINALMSGCAWNLKKMMEELKETFLQIIFQLFFPKNVWYYLD